MKIEKNIPIPEKRRTYPLDELDIGDSFLVQVPKEEIKSARNKLSASVSNASKTGSKFTVRVVDGGLRVWRTE